MPRTALLLLLVLAFGGCTLIPRSPLPALWFYTTTVGERNPKDSVLTPASFIDLRPDGTYTRDWNRFDYGTWKSKQGFLFLTDYHQKVQVLMVDKISMEEMQIMREGGSAGIFERIPSPPDPGDPFALKYNRWRIKSDHKETDEEIRRKLYNHCQFWEAYFTWALKNNISSVDVRSTPTAIKIWGNGFTLKPFEHLPDEWKSYFFDDEDCRKANDIIEDLFRNKTIAWAHTDNKYKLFIGAFQQLEDFLR
jgi:hypothetical protein